jgi:hypothetical protein
MPNEPKFEERAMRQLAFRISFIAAAFSAIAGLPACSNSGDAEATTTTVASRPPAVRSKSQPTMVREGDVALFTVTADGTQPMQYQWQRNGVEIAGATQRYYILSAATLADADAHYSVRISNEQGQIVTEVGHLIVVGKDATMPWF